MGWCKSRPRRRGAVLVLVGVCLVPLIGVLGFVLDGGMMLARRRHVQAAADAAALAAASSIYQRYLLDTGLDPLGLAAAAGRSLAASNGYTNDTVNSKVTINIPPSSASAGFAGTLGCAEAVVVWSQPRYFSAIFGAGKVDIRARAVAQAQSSITPSLVVTDIHLAGALTLTGGAKLVTNSDILVQSDSLYNLVTNPTGGAINISNGAFVNTGAGITQVTGDLNIPSWASISTFINLGKLIKKPVKYSDPYASMSPPSLSGLPTRTVPTPILGLATLNPGVYNGGLTLGGGMIVTMNPGLYYMKGGSFTVNNGVTLLGTGVTIYTDAGGGSLNLQGGTVVTLTSPTTTANGGIPGILYYQDRANTTALNNIANGSVAAMVGTIYAPNAPMSIAGGAIGAQYGSQFIVKSMNISNGVLLTITTPLSLTPNVMPPTLVE